MINLKIGECIKAIERQHRQSCDDCDLYPFGDHECNFMFNCYKGNGHEEWEPDVIFKICRDDNKLFSVWKNREDFKAERNALYMVLEMACKYLEMQRNNSDIDIQEKFAMSVSIKRMHEILRGLKEE
ncbi:MAG: hypothetical protein Ta2B_10470 [Termitinemataceae bacterium]|nr:MAG: hypothetical protein Ta2B_10470 [Termitinemataceae bacterium]